MRSRWRVVAAEWTVVFELACFVRCDFLFKIYFWFSFGVRVDFAGTLSDTDQRIDRMFDWVDLFAAASQTNEGSSRLRGNDGSRRFHTHR